MLFRVHGFKGQDLNNFSWYCTILRDDGFRALRHTIVFFRKQARGRWEEESAILCLYHGTRKKTSTQLYPRFGTRRAVLTVTKIMGYPLSRSITGTGDEWHQELWLYHVGTTSMCAVSSKIEDKPLIFKLVPFLPIWLCLLLLGKTLHSMSRSTYCTAGMCHVRM